MWRRYRAEVSDLLAGDLCAGYEDVVAGRSGIEAMDEWVSKLVGTGYLHNHADVVCEHLDFHQPNPRSIGFEWISLPAAAGPRAVVYGEEGMLCRG